MQTVHSKCEYTNRANPRRGYHDSDTTVTFEGYSEAEQAAYMETVRTAMIPCHMWVNGPRKTAPNTWIINHGYDSGD